MRVPRMVLDEPRTGALHKRVREFVEVSNCLFFVMRPPQAPKTPVVEGTRGFGCPLADRCPPQTSPRVCGGDQLSLLRYETSTSSEDSACGGDQLSLLRYETSTSSEDSACGGHPRIRLPTGGRGALHKRVREFVEVSNCLFFVIRPPQAPKTPLVEGTDWSRTDDAWYDM